MRTEQLIEMLSANVEAVKSEQFGKTLACALVVGGAASFSVMLATFGLRINVVGGPHLGFLALKVLFMLSLIGTGTALLIRLIRPGQDEGKISPLVLLPFIAAGLGGIVTLALEPFADWKGSILGIDWATCLFSIFLFSVIPFAVLIWALRRGAPTNLRRTGAIAGLVAGALGATAYAFHCPDDSLPFIAIWYGAMVAFCAWVGARLGPWLLRW